MEGGSKFRPWDELIPEALGIIFGNLSFEEVLTVVPSVCKSWNKVVKGPYCWQDIDIEDWSNRYMFSDNAETEMMLIMLMNRSCGSLHKLCVANLRDGVIFSSIAEKASSLHTLRLARCEMSDSTVEQIAGKLSSITFLDLSSCETIGSRALEAIGKNCKLLVRLCRNMHPINTLSEQRQDDEACAIAKTMPGIKHLEMAYNRISTDSVVDILTSCRELEFLDIRGCWDVELDENYLDEKFPKLKVLGPQNSLLDFNCNDYEYSEDSSEDYYEDDVYGGKWDADMLSDYEELQAIHKYNEGLYQDKAPFEHYLFTTSTTHVAMSILYITDTHSTCYKKTQRSYSVTI